MTSVVSTGSLSSPVMRERWPPRLRFFLPSSFAAPSGPSAPEGAWSFPGESGPASPKSSLSCASSIFSLFEPKSWRARKSIFCLRSSISRAWRAMVCSGVSMNGSQHSAGQLPDLS
jgi:hypothetical protein